MQVPQPEAPGVSKLAEKDSKRQVDSNKEHCQRWLKTSRGDKQDGLEFQGCVLVSKFFSPNFIIHLSH